MTAQYLRMPRSDRLVSDLESPDESPVELAAEVRGGEVGGLGQRGDIERLAVAGVGEVLGAEQVPDGVRGLHAPSIPIRRCPTTDRDLARSPA